MPALGCLIRLVSRFRSARSALPAVGIVLLLLSLALPSVADAHGRFARSRAAHPSRQCRAARHGYVECLSMRDSVVSASSPEAVEPAFEGSGELGGFAPSDLRAAYKLPETGGSGQTVAIVDAYNDPNAYSDLKFYRKTYKLSECTEESGCFKKVNQKGETKNYPANEAGWAGEISLDLDMASAICPGCHILLVEAEEPSFKDLGEAENEAVTLGATVVSNSYGGKEETGYSEFNKYYKHPGVPITVASGDNGYGVEFPAGSPYVIAVGGTALKKEEKSTRGWVEEVWRNPEKKVGERFSGTGSGCALKEEEKPTWQHDTPCKNRTDNDIAAVASNATPVSAYDTYEEAGWGDWFGTSVAAPIIAGVEGLAEKPVKEIGAKVFYSQPNSEFDVTKGNDGTCTPPVENEYLCTALAGYDGPTGMGAPDGVPVSSWVVKKGTETKSLKAGESEALAETITTKVKWVLKQTAGAGITVECTSVKFSSGFGESSITGPRGIKFGPVLFEGCKVTAPAGDTTCEVESTGFPNGQIRTQALGFIAEEALEGSSAISPHVKIPPESTREEIVTIQLKGASCANVGGYEIKGTLVASIDNSALHKAHVWEFSKTSGTKLTIGGVAAAFTGTGEFTLKSGNEWGDA